LLPSWAVDEVVEHWPERCGCGHVFVVEERVAVRAPARHQVEELPRIATVVVEHQCQRVRCPECGGEGTGELPVGVAGSAFGPRLQAAVATLAVRNRVSRRDTVELCSELFGARISAGSVDAILSRTADALELPHQQLVGALRRSGRLNIDETGWRLKGQRRTLWGAFTEQLAVYRIAADRHEDRARELLGQSTAIVTSDRWWAYTHLPLSRRQICWSHLQRDFTAQAEGIGAEREFGEAGLRICDELFWAWEIYQHTGERKELRRRIRLLRRELKPHLRRYSGKAPRYKRTRGLARNLLKVWPAPVDLRRPPRRAADQQPRRTRTPRRGHLSQALTRQAIPDGRTTHRTAALSIHHLPPTTPLATRIPQRTPHSPPPRRPPPHTRLTPTPSRRTERLHLFGSSGGGIRTRDLRVMRPNGAVAVSAAPSNHGHVLPLSSPQLRSNW
jgi:transposase